MDLTYLKSELINIVKAYYTKNIFQSAFKQRNAALAGGTAQADMDTEVSGLKTDIDAIETDINGLADTLIYDNFTEDSEANMIAHVATYCTGITKDQQKLAVAVALQNIQE